MKALINRLRLRTVLAVVVLLALALAASLTWSWQNQLEWPSQSPAQTAVPPQSPPGTGQPDNQPSTDTVKPPPPLAPEVKIKIEDDRDFGYRIGDIVPVIIYIKEKPGTRVDLHSLALEGNFEIAGQELGRQEELGLEQRKLDDGSTIMRFRVQLQSFSVAPKLTAKMSISYRVIAPNDEYTVVLPGVEVYTSNTWDKRDLVQTGPLTYFQGWHLLINSAITIAALVGLIFCYRLYRRYKSYLPVLMPGRRKVKRFVLARKRFDEVWARIMAGERVSAHYEEIERIVRKLFDIETKTTEEAAYWFLYGNRGPYRVIEILQLCDRVIYLRELLSEEDNNRIKEIFDLLVPNYSAELIAEVATLTAGPSERRRMRDEDPDALRERLTERPKQTD